MLSPAGKPIRIDKEEQELLPAWDSPPAWMWGQLVHFVGLSEELE